MSATPGPAPLPRPRRRGAPGRHRLARRGPAARQPRVHAADHRRRPGGAVILGGWLLGTAILAYAWWAARDRVPSGRWSLRTAALWAAPFLVVPPYGSRDVYLYACQGYLYGHGISPY